MPAVNPDLKEAVLNLVIDHGYAGVISAVASLVEDDYQLDIERRTISKRSGKRNQPQVPTGIPKSKVHRLPERHGRRAR